MTQDAAAVVFGCSAACVLYAYVVYPLAIWALVLIRGRPRPLPAPAPGSVSVVLAVLNEESFIARKLDELLQQLATLSCPSEVIVVSDGCTDSTAAIARTYPSNLVRVIELATNRGKAVALDHGCATAVGEIIVFSDARQRWAPDAMIELLRGFDGPEIGAVSGDLVLEQGSGATGGVGLYWRYEKWLRFNEGQLHSTVGVTGAIAAVRRSLFQPIPPGIVLDDVYWPLRVTMQGFRVVHRPSALAFDRLPETVTGEFRRKVRTLAGNFQLLRVLPSAVLPWRNPVWIQLLSHKMARLLVPWALLAMFGASVVGGGRLFGGLLALQASFYVVAIVGLLSPDLSRSRLTSVAASFVVLNAAAWLGFWMWATGQIGSAWKKVAYDSAPTGRQ